MKSAHRKQRRERGRGRKEGREEGREGTYRQDGLLGLHVGVAVCLHRHDLPVSHHRKRCPGDFL